VRIKKWDTCGLSLALIFCFFTILIFRPGFRLDSYAYYDFTRSILFDGDINYYNERNFSPSPVHFGITTATGFTNNIFPIGTGALWLPPALLYRVLDEILTHPGTPDIRSGLTNDFFILICLVSVFYVFIGLYLSYALVSHFFSKKSALMAVVFLFLASPLFSFTFILPSFSHGVSFFSVTLFLYLVVKYEENPFWALLTGLAAGLMVLVRVQNVFYLIFPLIFFLRDRKGIKITRWKIVLFLFAFLTVFSSQLLTWKLLNGSFLTPSSAAENMAVLHQWFNPVLLKQLFHLRFGLFSFTPIMLLGFLGLFFLWKDHPRSAVSGLLIFGLILYFNSTKSDWYGVGLYGARRFISFLPFLTIGFACLLEWRRRRYPWLSVLFVFCAIYGAFKNLASLVAIEAGRLSAESIHLLSFPDAFRALYLSIFNSGGWFDFFKNSLFLNSWKNLALSLILPALIFLFFLMIQNMRDLPSSPFRLYRIPALLGLFFFMFLTAYLLYSKWDSRMIFTVDCRTEVNRHPSSKNKPGGDLKKHLGRQGLKGKAARRPAQAGTMLPLVLRRTALYRGTAVPAVVRGGETIRLELNRLIKTDRLDLIVASDPDSAPAGQTGFISMTLFPVHGKTLSRKIPSNFITRRQILMLIKPARQLKRLVIQNPSGHPDLHIYGLSLEHKSRT